MFCSYLRAASLAVVCLVLAGCGPERPSVVPVSGTVLYEGKPVDGAQVSFMPQGGRPATAQTDAEGRFQLTTFEPKDGALVGDHGVTVSKMVDTGKKSASYAVLKSALPEKFQMPTTSGLTAKVTAEGPNDFRLELK